MCDKKCLINSDFDLEYADVLARMVVVSRERIYAPKLSYADHIKTTIKLMNYADLMAKDSIY